MRTIRLLIYDGPEDWMATQRGRDLKTPYRLTPMGTTASIRSVDLDPEKVEIFENPSEVDGLIVRFK